MMLLLTSGGCRHKATATAAKSVRHTQARHANYSTKNHPENQRKNMRLNG